MIDPDFRLLSNKITDLRHALNTANWKISKLEIAVEGIESKLASAEPSTAPVEPRVKSDRELKIWTDSLRPYRERLIAFLDAYPERVFRIGEIARHLRVRNSESISRVANRLIKELDPPIEKVWRGSYRARRTETR